MKLFRAYSFFVWFGTLIGFVFLETRPELQIQAAFHTHQKAVQGAQRTVLKNSALATPWKQVTLEGQPVSAEASRGKDDGGTGRPGKQPPMKRQPAFALEKDGLVIEPISAEENETRGSLLR